MRTRLVRAADRVRRPEDQDYRPHHFVNRGRMVAANGSELHNRCAAWRGKLGLEPTLELYVNHQAEIWREIKRVLRRDGSFWLSPQDSPTRAEATAIGLKL